MKKNRSLRSRVRTQWLALGGALVVLAGVLVTWGLSTAADRVPVMQVSQQVKAGEVITSDDLTITEVAVDGAVTGLVPPQSRDQVIGRVAAVDLQPGMLVSTGMWRTTPAVLDGERAVGVVLAPGRAPAGIAPGDTAVAAALQPGDTTAPVTVRVVDVRADDQGDLVLTLAVPADAAVLVAQLAATEQLVLVGAGGGV